LLGEVHLPLQNGIRGGYPCGMPTDRRPDTEGQPINPAPDIRGTLGIAWPQGPVWAIGWTLGTPDWAAVRHPDMPEDLRLRIRVADTEDGFAVVAALVERADGRPLAARDLRKVKLPPSWVLASSLSPVTSARPGPRGKGDEHWRAVFDLWTRAQQVAPHTPVRWMRTQWPGERSDATMRRWVKIARERAEINKWEEKTSHLT
jgi:hypothetical protein